MSKRRTHSRFSFSTRMKRSAQPLPSGSRTKAGELARPRKRISALEVVAHVLRAVIVAKGETAGDVLAEGAEALAHALTDRLERLEAIGAAAGVKANALGRAMIDRDEHRCLPFAGDHRGQVGTLLRARHRADRGHGVRADRLGPGRGDRVELRGFGVFSTRGRPRRVGRNPRTGDEVAVPGKLVPYFRVGKELHERLNRCDGPAADPGSGGEIGVSSLPLPAVARRITPS